MLGRDQRPLISTCSTSEAVAAWIGSSADRAGPTPTPSNGTDGDPDEVPALTTRFETVNGSRFSTLSVVLPSVRRAGLTVTKAPAIARSIALDKVAPSSTETDELSRNATLPSGSQASAAEHELTTIAPRVSPVLASVRMTFRKIAGADGGGKLFGFDDLERKPQKSQAVELAGQPPGLGGQRPFAPHLDEDAGAGQCRRVDQLAGARRVEGLDEPRGQGDLMSVHDLAGLLDHRLERQVVANPPHDRLGDAVAGAVGGQAA